MRKIQISLRVKMVLLCLVLTFLVSGGIMWIFVENQERNMLENAQKQADARLEMVCDNVSRLAVNSILDTMNEMTTQSMVQYYFSQYARILQTDKIQYSLWSDEVLYDIGSYDKVKNSIPGQGRIVDQVYYQSMETEIIGKRYHMYLAEDLSEVYEEIRDMRSMAWMLQGIGAAVLFVLLTALLGRALKPIETLKNQAQEIASGQYGLRTRIKRGDEIGQLAGSFDKMAEAVEEKIQSLTEELERRKFLIGALSHELKTPMASVIGYADSLLHMPLGEEEKTLCAEKIYRAAKRTEKLSQEMMELILLEQGEQIAMRRFPAKELTEGLRILWPKVRMECEARELYGDPILLQSLLSNLIDNAVKVSSPQDVRVHLTKERFQVADNGSGIPKEHLGRLTEPFYRVDKARSRKEGGAGLGLALCQQIARLHGGELQIESKEGEGTVVTVTLPRE